MEKQSVYNFLAEIDNSLYYEKEISIEQIKILLLIIYNELFFPDDNKDIVAQSMIRNILNTYITLENAKEECQEENNQEERINAVVDSLLVEKQI